MSLQPPQLQGYDFSKPDQARQYQYQMMLYLQSVQQQINLLQGTFAALTGSGTNVGSIAVNTAVQTNASLFVLVTVTFTANVTITLNNLAPGAVVVIQATASTAHTLKLAATNPSGTAYTSIKLTYAGGGTLIDLLATGQAYSAGVSATYAGLAGNLQLNLVGS